MARREQDEKTKCGVGREALQEAQGITVRGKEGTVISSCWRYCKLIRKRLPMSFLKGRCRVSERASPQDWLEDIVSLLPALTLLQGLGYAYLTPA